jgi:signal peptidase I
MDFNLKISTIRELWYQTSEQHWLPVQGISMLPLLHEGDSILVSYDLSTVRRGDILVYQRRDELIAHRVVRVINRSDKSHIFLTKGDRCTYFDPPLFGIEVLGRVNSIRKNGKEYDLTTRSWKFLNSLLATCHLLLGYLFQSAHHIKQSLHKKPL